MNISINENFYRKLSFKQDKLINFETTSPIYAAPSESICLLLIKFKIHWRFSFFIPENIDNFKRL